MQIQVKGVAAREIIIWGSHGQTERYTWSYISQVGSHRGYKYKCEYKCKYKCQCCWWQQIKHKNTNWNTNTGWLVLEVPPLPVALVETSNFQTALHLQTYFDRIRPFRLKDAVNNIVSSAARPSDDLSGCAELVACMRSNMLQCYRRLTTSHV